MEARLDNRGDGRPHRAAFGRTLASTAVAAACASLLAACGGSAGGPSHAEGSSQPQRSFHFYPEQRESRLHLSAGDCKALARLLEKQTGHRVRAVAEPSPPLSRCRLLGRGVHVTAFLDASYAARKRYENRMEEQFQFGTPDQAKLPHPVPKVGDPAPDNHLASWVPAYDTLFAVRGNRWLTVAYSVRESPPSRRLAGAASLARLGFRLSAR